MGGVTKDPVGRNKQSFVITLLETAAFSSSNPLLYQGSTELASMMRGVGTYTYILYIHPRVRISNCRYRLGKREQ